AASTRSSLGARAARRPVRVAAGAPRPRRPGALRSCSGGGDRRVTHEEARAQFPVLERYAYLNAGSNGPLPHAAVDAFRSRLERDLTEGRSGKAYVEEMVELRERVRNGLGAVLGASAELVALADSTTR